MVIWTDSDWVRIYSAIVPLDFSKDSQVTHLILLVIYTDLDTANNAFCVTSICPRIDTQRVKYRTTSVKYVRRAILSIACDQEERKTYIDS